MGNIVSFEQCIQKTKTPYKLAKKNYLECGKFPVISQEEVLISGFHDESSHVFRVSKPVVIFGDHTKVLKYVDFDFVVGADGVKILLPNEKLDTKYFYYVLKALMPKEVKGYARHYKLLKELDIPILPLIEQQRIVTKLDATFAEIDEALKLDHKKEIEIELLKASLLSTTLNEETVIDNKLALDDACNLISRGISPKYIEAGGIRVLNQKCIRNHSINYDLARRHDILKKNINKERLIQKGDILINSTGTGTLGRVAQVRDEPYEPTTVDSHVTIVRPKHELFYLDFFGYAAILIEDEIKDAGQGTSGQTELSKTKLKEEFYVSIPSNFDEQKLIVAKLDAIFAEVETVKNAIKRKQLNYQALKSSILVKELQSEVI